MEHLLQGANTPFSIIFSLANTPFSIIFSLGANVPFSIIFSNTVEGSNRLRTMKIVLAKGSSSHPGRIMHEMTCRDHEDSSSQAR